MKALALSLALALLLSTLPASGCRTGDASTAVVDNAYPQSVVYKVWWSVTLFSGPVPAGQESAANQVVPSTDYAYALLAPSWNPASGAAPTALVPMKTKETLTVARGDTLHITLSDATATGNCAGGEPLSQADADFITKRIFPAEFEGVAYDAATCTTTPLAGAGD